MGWFLSNPTRVVHCKLEPYDIYIGRGSGSIWGNPFVVGVHGQQGECVAKFREWIQTQPRLLSRLHELKGKTLGCWCKVKSDPTRSCHGDVLAELADALPVVDLSDIDLEGI